MSAWLFWSLLGIQLLTYAGLGAYFVAHGNLRLGLAQLLLLGVQALLFSAGSPT